MRLSTVWQVPFICSLFLLPVRPEGVRCPNANYRIFAAYSGPSDVWSGNKEGARKMCQNHGHILAKDVTCVHANWKSLFRGDKVLDYGWLHEANDTLCTWWSHPANSTQSVPCSNSAIAICQGFSSTDSEMAVAYKSGQFPYTQIFGATTSRSETGPPVDAYYVLCGILGVILIAIVISAAIWRSGYINNKYSFRRLPPAAAATQRPAPKSHTAASVVDSEIPHGYVKASVTKETLA